MDGDIIWMDFKCTILSKRTEARGYIQGILCHLYDTLEKTKLGKENGSETWS